MSVKIYKAIDRLDGRESLFAIKEGFMDVSSYWGEDDPWLSADCLESLFPDTPLDWGRMINPVLVAEHPDA